jgi:histidyl-tRNA synthetase
MKFTAPKGTRDILPAEAAAWQHAERVFSDVCSRFGYREIRIPTFEQTELFQRGVGDSTDIVQKEMYTFLDKGGRSLSLRPEGTAGVVRSYVENGMASWPAPVRLYYMITAFRYENVQKGRYREFHQFGCEAIGTAGPEADAELISLLWMFFQALGLEKTSLMINSIGCPVCRTAYQQLLQQFLRPLLPDLCGHCRERFDKNPLRVIDCKEARCQAATRGAPTQLDHLCPTCAAHFQGLCDSLVALGIPYAVNPRIVRGLDYYTRTVFEFVSEHVGTQGTICGGGRYDGLTEEIGGPPTPGIGFALGVERLLMEVAAQGKEAAVEQPMTVFVANAAPGSHEALALCQLLRQKGVRAETDLLGRSLKAQMKYAGKSGCRLALVIGDEEIRSGTGKLRDLANGSEQAVSLASLPDQLKAFQDRLGQAESCDQAAVLPGI